NEMGELPWDVRTFVAVERRLMALFLKVIRHKKGGPLSKVAVSEVTNIPSFVINPFADLASVQRIAEQLQPDLILLLGPHEWATGLSTIAEHGCWVVGPDLVDEDFAGIGLLGTILRREPATHFGLELISGDAKPLVMSSTWGATRAVSFSQHRELAFLKLPALLLRALRQLSDGKPLSVRGSVSTLRSSSLKEKLTGGAGLRALGITLRMLAESGVRRRKARQPWFVLIPRQQAALDPDAPSIGSHATLVAPGNNYWADPFPLVESGRNYLFVEEFLEGSNKGVISCLELDDAEVATHHGVVLEEPFHLSYPQVFRHDGSWYMMVESCEADRVSLYRTDAFPGDWKRVADLIHGRLCVDPTLHHHAGHWYLFGNVSESGGNPSDELFLFISEKLEGPYRAHPANPIVSDVRRSRPAGRLFMHADRLIRPAQCCAPIYGSAVVFNEVLELTPETYVERPVSRLDPSWAPSLDGCHTYNRDGDLEAIDAHGQVPQDATLMQIDYASTQAHGARAESRKSDKGKHLELMLTAASLTWLL
ncbi:MAG: hypothetical protein ABI858_09435, partial [Pseudoxanthomonas sp.]